MTSVERDLRPVTDEDRNLEALVRASPFPVFVIQLPDSLITEVSDAAVQFAGRPRAELLSMRLLDYVFDPEVAAQSLALVAEGKIDGYTRQGRYRQPTGDYRPLTIRISAFTDQCPRRRALAMFLESPQEPVVPRDQPDDAAGFVLGTIDDQWRIDRITSDVGHLLHYEPESLLGQSTFTVVHPEDISQLLLFASEAAARHGESSGRIRLRTADGGWIQCRVSVTPLAGTTPGGYAFALCRVDPDRRAASPRQRELEDHLRRIAREVSASGVAALTSDMPTALDVPELSTLTSREYEIVVRLVGGERVSAIARRLFLSESTVRNHLTAVYRKLGVGSQGELVARLGAASRP